MKNKTIRSCRPTQEDQIKLKQKALQAYLRDKTTRNANNLLMRMEITLTGKLAERSLLLASIAQRISSEHEKSLWAFLKQEFPVNYSRSKFKDLYYRLEEYFQYCDNKHLLFTSDKKTETSVEEVLKLIGGDAPGLQLFNRVCQNKLNPEAIAEEIIKIIAVDPSNKPGRAYNSFREYLVEGLYMDEEDAAAIDGEFIRLLENTEAYDTFYTYFLESILKALQSKEMILSAQHKPGYETENPLLKVHFSLNNNFIFNKNLHNQSFQHGRSVGIYPLGFFQPLQPLQPLKSLQSLQPLKSLQPLQSFQPLGEAEAVRSDTAEKRFDGNVGMVEDSPEKSAEAFTDLMDMDETMLKELDRIFSGNRNNSL